MGDQTQLILVIMVCLIVLSVAEGANEPLRLIHASEVLDKIKSGQPAEFDNCAIVDDLNLSALKIEGPIHFKHTLFQNSVFFESTIFNTTADFRDSTFNRIADFNNATFNNYADFRSSKFNSTTDSHNYADFSYSKFNSIADFSDSKFYRDAYFLYSTLNSSAVFSSSKFNNEVYFDFSKFKSSAIFSSSRFNSNAAFCYSKFKSTADFNDSKFYRDAYFLYSTFNNTAVFSFSKFNSTADFDESRFEKETNFNDAGFNGRTSFNNSQFVDNALFLNANFNGTLCLTRTNYDRLYVKWNSIHDLAYDDTAYQLLIENFRNLGFNKDADNCYFQFRVDQIRYWGPTNWFDLGDKFRYILDVGTWIFYGYGNPLYPFGGSIVIIISFGVIWDIIDRRRREIILDEFFFTQDLPKEKWHKISSIIKPLIFSTTVFLSGTRLFIDPPEIPEVPRVPKAMIKAIFTLERVFGAFLSILLFMAIGATVIRQ